MALEIERKFLVADISFRQMASGCRRIRQAYLNSDPARTVRLRVTDDRAWITVKGRNSGVVRHEWEYPVPVADAEEMARQLTDGWAIDKTRYVVYYEGFTWEVDVFHGRHEGLTVAEVELPSPDVIPPLPSFIGTEVTGDPRYYNSNLAGN